VEEQMETLHYEVPIITRLEHCGQDVMWVADLENGWEMYLCHMCDKILAFKPPCSIQQLKIVS